MINLAIMLALLLLPYAATRITAAYTQRKADLHRPAALGAGLLFAFTAFGHFAMTDAMVQMLPDVVPMRRTIVLMTGVLEVLVAIGFLFARTRRAAAIAALCMLVAFFPANVYAAFIQAPMGGHVWGPAYLLLRAPVQLIIIGWIVTRILRNPAVPYAQLTSR